MHGNKTVGTTFHPSNAKNLSMCRTGILLIDSMWHRPFIALIIGMH